MAVAELHFRVLYLVCAVAVLALLRKPIHSPDRPGSTWFALTVGGLFVWLGGVGLYYFAHGLRGSLVLYNLVLFAITVCFVGWLLIAVEFATGKSASRPILLALGAFAAIHFLLLWTNFFWLHELVYRSTTFVDDGGGLNARRGPLFWVHIVTIYVLVFLSTVLFVAEWANASGLRRRQAGILAVTPVTGVGASLIWFAEVLPFPFDPTPVGVAVGVALLSWALYRAEFLEIAPVARQTVVEEMTDAVIILDDENRVVDWNAAAYDLFGVEGATVGMSAAAFFEPIPSETLAGFVDADRVDGQASFELDGRDRHVSVSISSIDVGGSNRLGRAIVVRDITGIKRRERQLLRQNEYLEEFANIVSHDLQGPIMEIRGSADMARRTRDVSHVDHVLDATDRIEQLVDDLLRLARTGRQIEAVEPVELSTVAEAAWIGVWDRNAELDVTTDHRVIADPHRVQQLLENLFRNAVEHSSTSSPSQAQEDAVEHGSTSPASHARQDDGRASSSEPSVAAAPEDAVEYDSTDDDETRNRVTLSFVDDAAAGTERAGDPSRTRITVGSLPDGFYVEDDGPGIPSEDRERVFDRGYTTSPHGTGLGLGIVRQIAGAHGWSVRVTEGDAGGARFEITGVDVED